MHYLTCFRPTESLTSKLDKEPSLIIPSSGLHCTIWGFNLREENEGEVLEVLSRLETEPFTTEVIGDSYFDLDSHVLLLTKPEALQQLHEKIVRVARPFDKSPHLFDEMLLKYGMKQYHPHITISKSRDKSPLQGNYEGTSMRISKYDILKNKNGIWTRVKDFNLV